MKRRRSIVSWISLGVAALFGSVSVLAVFTGAVASNDDRITLEQNLRSQPTTYDFCAVAAMRAHHEQALSLGDGFLASGGGSSELRSLAEYMVRGQAAEIEEMSAWTTSWEVVVGADVRDLSASHNHGPSHEEGVSRTTTEAPCAEIAMVGMAAAADLDRLAASTGDTAAAMFVDLMTRHHEGGIVMATDALRRAHNVFVLESSRHVIREQQREVEQMANLLAGNG